MILLLNRVTKLILIVSQWKINKLSFIVQWFKIYFILVISKFYIVNIFLIFYYKCLLEKINIDKLDTVKKIGVSIKFKCLIALTNKTQLILSFLKTIIFWKIVNTIKFNPRKHMFVNWKPITMRLSFNKKQKQKWCA